MISTLNSTIYEFTPQQAPQIVTPFMYDLVIGAFVVMVGCCIFLVINKKRGRKSWKKYREAKEKDRK